MQMINEHKFDELCQSVKFCTRCTRMEESARVLSRAAGPIDARLMFIGEAPGRLGAEVHDIPFHGDKAGHNFEELLSFAGISRSLVFVTNAVLCNPKSDSGNNATPNRHELSNCSTYLRAQIELVDPRIIISLGTIALEALRLVSPHSLQLSDHVRTAHHWYSRLLIPLYHPGARAMIHRSMTNQRSDYQFVAEQYHRLDRVRRTTPGTTKEPVALLASEIIRARGSVSYFALHKLLFLVECEAWNRIGRGITEAYFIRQKDGPYCTDLHLAKLRRAIPELTVLGKPDHPILRLAREPIAKGVLPSGTRAIVTAVLSASAALSDSELKTRVYLSSPMRRILRLERTLLVNLHNSPIQFGNESGRGVSRDANHETDTAT